jgi:hypothetical protein
MSTIICPNCKRALAASEPTFPIWIETGMVNGGCQECCDTAAEALLQEFARALRDAMPHPYPPKRKEQPQ